MAWIQKKWQITKYYWRWCWMSRVDRKREKAMRKMLFNLFSNAPIEKIQAGEDCSWSMTPGQEKGTMEGVQAYVKAVTGEDVKMVTRELQPKQRDIREVISPDQVMNPDPSAREVISRAFNAPPGTCVIGHADDKGELHVEEKEMK